MPHAIHLISSLPIVFSSMNAGVVARLTTDLITAGASAKNGRSRAIGNLNIKEIRVQVTD